MIADFLQTNGVSPKKILCIGDSITQGAVLNTHVGPEDSYRYRLWYSLRGAGKSVEMVGPFSQGGAYTAWDNKHAGVPGTKMPAMELAAPAWISTYSPDWVIIMGGTNDTNDTITAAGMIARLESLIDTVIGALGTTNVIVCTIPERAGRKALIDGYNALMPAACAGKSVHFVDASSTLTASGFTSDLIHPTSLGYLIQANAIAAKMKTLL